MAVVPGQPFKVRFMNTINNATAEIAGAIKKVFNGIITSISDLASNPIKLAYIFLFGVAIVDLVFVGKIGVVNYVIAQIGVLAETLKGLSVPTIVFLAFVIMMFFKEK